MTNSSPNMKGGVRAVIFDISGTTVDYGSRGPVVAFVELFARHGVAVSKKKRGGPWAPTRKTISGRCSRIRRSAGAGRKRRASSQLGRRWINSTTNSQP